MSFRAPTAELLATAGIRPTSRRITLFDALVRFARPVSAEELHAKVAADLVTVYRTLESFAVAGLIREVRFKDTTTRYECAESAHHHHLVCTTCGIIDELPECDLAIIERTVLRASDRFATINEHALEFFGTCVRCTAHA